MAAAGGLGEGSACCSCCRHGQQTACPPSLLRSTHLLHCVHLAWSPGRPRHTQRTQAAPRQTAVAGAPRQQVVQWSICMLTLVELDICQRRWMDDLHPCWHEQSRGASQPPEHTIRGTGPGRYHTRTLTAGGAPLHTLLHGL